jgi:hypothetical protein
LEGRLLRPLCAKLLPPTQAEIAGRIDRNRLHAFSGRGRKELIRLARQLGLSRIPSPSTGCALTEPAIAAKVHDLLELQPDNRRWDFELLRIGRHVRYDRTMKVALGRREEENLALKRMFQREDAPECTLLEPHNFMGPTALMIGMANEDHLHFAAGLIGRYGRLEGIAEPLVAARSADQLHFLPAGPHTDALNAAAI